MTPPNKTPAKPAKPAVNGAPKKNPQVAAKTPEPPDADDLDEAEDDVDDDDLDAPVNDAAFLAAKKVASKKHLAKFAAMTPAEAMTSRTTALRLRLVGLLDSAAGWPATVRDTFQDAIVACDIVVEAIAKLPPGFEPIKIARKTPTAKAAAGAPELKVGDIIRITDKRIPEYEGVLEANEMVGLEVLEVRGPKVITKTAFGMKAMLPRGHVCLDTTAAA